MIDWCFRSRRTGRITVAQTPNAPLWIFLATVVLRRFIARGAARTTIDWVAVVSLAWWALDEVIRGVNPWRRLLGVAGCGFAVSGLISLAH